MADHIGQQLGNYRVIRPIGRGGFAVVYLGEHIYLKTQVAIKVLQTRINEEAIADFLNEARTIAHLFHPHIVRVIDFGLENETPFLVMDYATNGTLRRRYSKGTRLPQDIVLTYVKQVAIALQHAHSMKIIHRDVKPENILLGHNEEVLLSDFGIALLAQSSRYQSTQDIVGTVAYMAPEQIQGKPRPASDQYSLGVVVYEWLSGDRPFRGSFTELCTQHMFAPPPPLRERIPEISPYVEEVVQIALAKDFKQRFVNVQAFATALEQACRLATSSLVQPLEPPAQAIKPSTSLLQTPQLVMPSGPPAQSTPISLPPSLQLDVPSKAAGTALCIYRGHSQGINSLTWSPDGKFIASGSDDGSVQIWDAKTGDKKVIYTGHAHWVRAVAWSPDGIYIASGSDDCTVQLWKAVNGDHVLTYTGHAHWVNAIVWSHDAKRIASGSHDKTVQIWDRASGDIITTYNSHTASVLAVAWSRDGKYIASGGDDKTMQVWEALNGNQLSTYHHSSGTINTAAWSPNAWQIASGGTDRTVDVWNAQDGNKVNIYNGHSASILGLAWSPNGKYLASASVDCMVKIWDVATRNNVLTYPGHAEYVRAIAWSPDGKQVASGSWDSTVQICVAP